ncbi:DUF6465 family protein [Parablautia muri]|uniref:Uncharacterized protein n=1 Tax=Parablautia muri TaxID=2320879 RepID=A0A9X5BDT8_9FIRM|nr:DUF6465 family protein [Parablautia muri]NBJ91847.1 hypothetical protein [Parablautia muri]
MAETKRGTTKAIAKAESAEEVKAAPEAEVKEPEKKTTGRKTTAKKDTTAKKPAVKRAAAKKETVDKKEPEVKQTPAKRTVKKAQVTETVTFQFNDRSYTPDDLMQSCKNVWKYDLEGKEEDLKSIELYVKPEENRVYFVINGDITGNFPI